MLYKILYMILLIISVMCLAVYKKISPDTLLDYRRLNYEMVNLIEELKDKAVRYEKMAGYVKGDKDA